MGCMKYLSAYAALKFTLGLIVLNPVFLITAGAFERYHELFTYFYSEDGSAVLSAGPFLRVIRNIN